jgi:23S rRNA pseudouridine2457 synthase
MTEEALQKLREGVVIEGKMTLPAEAKRIHPDLPPRDPPIRQRQNIPTSWLELTLHEGRNRQVRKMTAAVGFPTLRLLRVAIGQFHLPSDLTPGHWRKLAESDRSKIL